MSVIPGHKLHQFFNDQANVRLYQNLKDAETKLHELVDLVNAGKLPQGMEKFGPIRSNVDYFTKAKPAMFALVSELSSFGVRFRDVTSWRKSRALGIQQANEQPTQQAQVRTEEGFKAKLKSIPSLVANVLSPEPLEEQKPVVLEEPFDSVPALFRKGCTYVREFGPGMADLYIDELRMAVATRVTGLLRDIRTYTNELLMEVGDQIAVIAK